MSDSRKKIAEALLKTMSDRKLTQKELGSMLGVTQSAIARYIKQERMPKPSVLIQLAYICNVSVNELVGKVEFDFNHIQNLIKSHKQEMTIEQKLAIIKELLEESERKD